MMVHRMSPPLNGLVLAAALLLGGAGNAEDASPGAAATSAAQASAVAASTATIEGATIEGTVTYQADPARSWRYARFYVRSPKSGELAEAVVALRSRGRGAAAPPREPATVVIDQQNFQFVPETVAIRVGDTVRFTNADAATHNVQSSAEIASFNVNLPLGGQFEHRFDRAGGIRRPVQLGCVYHGSMRAWIFVFDQAYFQVTAADGQFRLTGVPPGQYELEVFHPAGNLRWRKEINAVAGGQQRVDVRLPATDAP